MATIISLAEAKAYLNVGNTDYDAYLTTLLSVADKQITNMINQEVQEAAHTYVFSGNGTYYTVIPKFPIIAITSLKERSSILTDFGSVTAIDSANYTQATEGNVDYLYYNNGFSQAQSNFQLIYTYGYTTGNEPDDIKLVAKEIVSQYFKDTDIREGIKSGRLGINSISENYQGMSINTQFKDLYTVWERRLAPYRVPSV